MQKVAPLLSRQFICYCAVMFLAFCNLAVFFQFNDYLKTLPLEADWSGFLIGIFSLTVLTARPIVSPFIDSSNARVCIVTSSVSIIVALLLYSWGTTVISMAAVRIFHGLSYTVLAVAALSGVTAVIPPERSGQAFGLISVLTLLPYAVIPPFLGPLGRIFGGFDATLGVFAAAMILVFPLAAFGIPPGSLSSDRRVARVTRDEFMRNLRDPRILLLLVSSLLVWSAFTPVFYYIKGFGQALGVPNAGWFFTLSTFSEIGVRLACGPFLDRVDKSKALGVSLVWLIGAYGIMTCVSGTAAFYAMGIVFGVGWGLAMPMLSSLMFDLSAPKFRGLNSNLSMEMFQGGYFVGPLVGGTLLIQGGYQAMFLGCALMILTALVCALPLMKNRTGRS